MNWVNLNINISQLEELLNLYEESENFDKNQAIKYNIGKIYHILISNKASYLYFKNYFLKKTKIPLKYFS